MAPATPTAAPPLDQRWLAAWPEALASWSRYTRLRSPALCPDSARAQAAGLSSSFAMIRLADQTVVIDLAQVAQHGLEDFAIEVLAHEIGHHVYAPGTLSDHARCLARIASGLLDQARHAPVIANLYTDLLINDRLQRSAGLRMREVFQRLVASESGPQSGKLWRLYLRMYEILWALARGTLCTSPLDDAAEGDARLGARLVRHYGSDWLRGAGGFAALVYPHLIEDQQAGTSITRWHDTGDAGLGGEIHGLSQMDADESTAPLHPALDPALGGGAGARAGSDPGVPVAGAPSAAGHGQLRTPYQYGELLRLAGVRIDQHEAAVRYYRECAEPHLVPFPARRRPRSTDPLPEGLESWDMGQPFDRIDWLQTVLVSPQVIPGLTTVQRVYGHSEGAQPKALPLDLDLYVDSSGSMPDPRHALSYPALAGAVICLSALRAGARVQVTLWSSKKQALSTPGYVRDRHAILRVLTGYYGGGTQFPLPLLRDTHAARKPGAAPAHIMCVSDDGASTMFDSPDERGTSGFEVCRLARAQAGGGGTLVLNLWPDWEKHARIHPKSAYGALLAAKEKFGWDIHRVTELKELLDFARAFARRHYLPPAPQGAELPA